MVFHENTLPSIKLRYLINDKSIAASNKRIKPIDVRKIEHEDFIDYEIEFVELSQDDSVDEARPEEFIFKQTDESDSFLDNPNSKVSSDKDQNYSIHGAFN